MLTMKLGSGSLLHELLIQTLVSYKSYLKKMESNGDIVPKEPLSIWLNGGVSIYSFRYVLINMPRYSSPEARA